VASWHGRARLVVGVFLVAFATLIFFAIRERRTPAATKNVEIVDPKAIAETARGVISRTKFDRPDFTLEFERGLSYADGSTRFLQIKATIPQRAGRSFEITGAEARIGAKESNVEIIGSVRMTSSDGIDLRTDRATYDQAEGIVRIPGKVEFTRERMSGSGVGATYDRNRDVLWLLDQAHILVKPDERGQGASEITAGAAALARRDKYARFERTAKIVRDGRIMEADGIVAFLSQDEKRIEMVEMRGASRVSGGGGGAGSLQAMTARDINLHYAPDGQALTRATLTGDSAIQLAAAAGQGGRRLGADFIDALFAADGTTVTSLTARDRVDLTLPADAAAPARRIRADALEGRGEPPDGLKSARFTGNVEFREIRAATKTAGDAPSGSKVCADSARLDRIARARTLDTSLKPGFSAIDRARFEGDVCFRDGDLTAQAPSADYQVVAGTLLLVSDPKLPAAPATVVDAQTSIQGTTIDLTLQGRSLTAKGDVRSVLQPSKPGAKAPADKNAPKRPGMLKNDQPVYVTGQELQYDGTTRLAIYTGDARLWQGQTAVQAATLTLDEQKGNLLAKGGARSTLQMEQTNEKTKTKDKITSIASADELLYEDNVRRATYTTNAHVTGPQGDLTADKVELYLLEGGSELERAEAYGSVVLKDQNRTGTGARMTYFTKDERYTMSGTPVRVVEQDVAECRIRTTEGRTLTFYKSVDTIRVDGIEKRTEARTAGKCPEP